ncbi:hypothetical protein BD413DRAFT_470222 [Trametes elegans]|nr:hypothetical protein BD413DRAFT_470222 [Trametes elegans]
MNVEKDGPSISYETFVEELDEGDSFTTSLIDVLVKEMAERRTRPNPVDRRLISERTAKSLRMQAAPLHIYRSGQSNLRNRPSRRSIPVLPPRSSYSAFHDILSESDGDEEYGNLINPSGTVEGARLNTDLYDAYFPSTYDLPGSLSRQTESGAVSPPSPLPTGPAEPGYANWTSINPRPQSPPSTRSTLIFGSSSGPSSSLTRQSSIRRAHRSRTMDFNDFTSRRRSAMRSSTAQEDGPRGDSLSGDNSGRPSLFGTRRPSESSFTADSIHPYGLLPWSTIRRRSVPSTSGSVAGNAGSTSDTMAEPSGAASSNGGLSSSHLWYTLTSTTTSTSEPAMAGTAGLPSGSASGENDEDRPQVVAPRLRRGGLRPPEALQPHQYDALFPDVVSHGPSSADANNPTTSSTSALASGHVSSSPSDTTGVSSVHALVHSSGSPTVESR